MFLARPLLVTSRQERSRITRRQLLLAQKEATLAQIRELDFDHSTGKLPAEVHEIQRAELVAKAAAILEKIDELDKMVTSQLSVSADEKDIDAEIEAIVARLRKSSAAANAKYAVTAKRQVASHQSNGYCPQCGQSVDAGDKFCASCGHKLHAKIPA